jgi:hypothetical protein
MDIYTYIYISYIYTALPKRPTRPARLADKYGRGGGD